MPTPIPRTRWRAGPTLFSRDLDHLARGLQRLFRHVVHILGDDMVPSGGAAGVAQHHTGLLVPDIDPDGVRRRGLDREQLRGTTGAAHTSFVPGGAGLLDDPRGDKVSRQGSHSGLRQARETLELRPACDAVLVQCPQDPHPAFAAQARRSRVGSSGVDGVPRYAPSGSVPWRPVAWLV